MLEKQCQDGLVIVIASDTGNLAIALFCAMVNMTPLLKGLVGPTPNLPQSGARLRPQDLWAITRFSASPIIVWLMTGITLSALSNPVQYIVHHRAVRRWNIQASVQQHTLQPAHNTIALAVP